MRLKDQFQSAVNNPQKPAVIPVSQDLRKALKDNDRKKWNKTVKKIRDKYPDREVIIDFGKKTLNNTALSKFDFSGLSFRGLTASKCIFTGCNFEGSRFDLGDMKDEKDIEKYGHRHAMFQNCTFAECNMGIIEINGVHQLPLFDAVEQRQIDERKIRPKQIYRGGCEFLSCTNLPEYVNEENLYMVHDESYNPNPTVSDKMSEDTDDLVDHYDPRSKRIRREYKANIGDGLVPGCGAERMKVLNKNFENKLKFQREQKNR